LRYSINSIARLERESRGAGPCKPHIYTGIIIF
ncbi:hypothetical protein CP061683_0617, partial [Chlamydia psittaci 06-1683]